MEVVCKGILALVLAINGVYDMKTKKVSIPVLIIGFIVLLALLPFNPSISFGMAMGGVFWGILLLFVSLVSKGRIGFGDGLVISMTGLCLGFWENLNLILISFVLAGVFGLVGMVSKKINKEQKIPFVPFITMAYLGMWCL